MDYTTYDHTTNARTTNMRRSKKFLSLRRILKAPRHEMADVLPYQYRSGPMTRKTSLAVLSLGKFQQGAHGWLDLFGALGKIMRIMKKDDIVGEKDRGGPEKNAIPEKSYQGGMSYGKCFDSEKLHFVWG
ncbi:Hypothetical protein NTJ_16217 [Nesidiocoris tenuis]|uniref:Uncharacterized protein n=1 Tax=Nesidiocoris tenuis TaxID=355587 RepID=A0ABN7BGH2_9HEMI|nr:Hypothetical protein NTJ_16217 [Nesidiocoris tenuis]